MEELLAKLIENSVLGALLFWALYYIFKRKEDSDRALIASVRSLQVTIKMLSDMVLQLDANMRGIDTNSEHASESNDREAVRVYRQLCGKITAAHEEIKDLLQRAIQ